MGVRTRQVTTFTCDLCGHETEDGLDRGGCVNVESAITLRDAHTGEVGHANFREWWCGDCLNSFAQWQRSRRGGEGPF